MTETSLTGTSRTDPKKIRDIADRIDHNGIISKIVPCPYILNPWMPDDREPEWLARVFENHCEIFIPRETECFRVEKS